MSDPLAQLKAALADRYAIERELGSGEMATVAATLSPERFLRGICMSEARTHTVCA